MVEIRPIWLATSELPAFAEAEINELREAERSAITAANTCKDVARIYVGENEMSDVAFLDQSARVDLVAGCELARCGYFKQAYSLWRSWYEQSLFLLYFLEAPVHKAAWKVSAEVKLEDSPQYRLMLHQLLTESGEKHAFAIVYNDRFTKLAEALRVSGITKANRPVQKAVKILTALSQGIHGTYQPAAAKSMAELRGLLKNHCLPLLNDAADSLMMFWLLLLTTYVAIPPNMLVKLRDGAIDPKEIEATGLEEPMKVAELAPLFQRAFRTNTK